MAFFNRTNILGREATFDDGNTWRPELQVYSDERIQSITKERLLNFFIRNFSNGQNTNEIKISFDAFTRSDNILYLINRINDYAYDNTIMFFRKTSISGRAISYIATEINKIPGITMTELTNVSLLLQTSTSAPIRVYKIVRDDHTTQYAVIGHNNMKQEAYYICLGLVTNWFPELLENIDDEKVNAIKNLCYSIGNMEENAYVQSVRACFALCTEPPLPEIDYTTIVNMFSNNAQARINTLRSEHTRYQGGLEDALQKYEQYKTKIQQIEWELSKLMSEPPSNNAEANIQIAKNFKSIVHYVFRNDEHLITIRSKMMLDSDAIVKRIIEPNNTSAHNHYYINSESERKLLEDLWINKTLQLDFCTTFAKYRNEAMPYIAQTPIPRLTTNTIPNPHLAHYSCFGSNRKQLIDANNANNLEYYLGTLTASNSNLNTGDATVLQSFCRDILDRNKNKPILYDVETKQYVSPAERMKTYETV